MTNNEEDLPNHYEYYEELTLSSQYHYYLSSEIDEPKHYIKMIHNLNSCQPSDTVIIHLNSIGGDLAAGLQIINAIKYSSAHVICSLEGEAFSVASMIFLAADEFIVHNNSRLMIHHYSGAIVGKGCEQVSQLKADIEWFATLSNDIYIPFLSERELKTVLNGEELWLNTKDIRKRLKKMVKQKS